MTKLLNTKQIISHVAQMFLKSFPNHEVPYDTWVSSFRFWEQNIPEETTKQLKALIPVRDSIAKLIYQHLYIKMPFDREYIFKKYEHQFEDVEYLLYPSTKTKRLVVLLSGYSDKKTYNRYSWYWDENEQWETDTSYLFINDTTGSWYSGFDDERRYSKYINILNNTLNSLNITSKQTFLVGGSMGGYGAIRLGMEISAGGIIAINPQTSINAAKFHNDPTWSVNIERCGDNFIPVDQCIETSDNPPPLYFECGKYAADHEDVKKILASASDKRISIFFNLHGSDKHVTYSPAREKVEALISLFENSAMSLDQGELDAEKMVGVKF